MEKNGRHEESLVSPFVLRFIESYLVDLRPPVRTQAIEQRLSRQTCLQISQYCGNGRWLRRAGLNRLAALGRSFRNLGEHDADLDTLS